MIDFFEALFEASIRSLILAAVVYLLLWALRVRDAAWKHAAWTAELCAMLVMPILPHFFPPVPVNLPIAPIPVMNLAEAPKVTGVAPPIATPVTVVPVHAFDWSRVWIGMYLFGSTVLITRLMLGWWRARRLLGGSAFVPSLAAYESASIAGPLTIGAFRPNSPWLK